jgi:hypothetical protein
MKTQTHTPEALEIYYDSSADIYLVVEKDSYHDWSVERPDERFIFARCATEEQAEYICAAPELLEAVKMAQEVALGLSNKYPRIGEGINTIIDCLQAAIAKAEGR